MKLLFWLLAWMAASLPWLNSRAFGIYGHWFNQSTKPIWLTLLESLILYTLTFCAMFVLEAQQGQSAPQTWQFWVVSLCFWVVLSFPAMAWFKLRKQ